MNEYFFPAGINIQSPVQRESLKQFDDDIDILKAYLKTQRAPKAAIEALEDLTVDLHKSWKIATGKIKETLGE